MQGSCPQYNEYLHVWFHLQNFLQAESLDIQHIVKVHLTFGSFHNLSCTIDPLHSRPSKISRNKECGWWWLHDAKTSVAEYKQTKTAARTAQRCHRLQQTDTSYLYPQLQGVLLTCSDKVRLVDDHHICKCELLHRLHDN